MTGQLRPCCPPARWLCATLSYRRCEKQSKFAARNPILARLSAALLTASCHWWILLQFIHSFWLPTSGWNFTTRLSMTVYGWSQYTVGPLSIFYSLLLSNLSHNNYGLSVQQHTDEEWPVSLRVCDNNIVHPSLSSLSSALPSPPPPFLLRVSRKTELQARGLN